jgi:hypothetical protein
MQFIKSAWRGEQPLWKVYWLGGITIALTAAIVFGVVAVKMGGLPLETRQTINFIFLIPWIWWYRSVWRCAPNASSKFFTYLGRFAIFLAVIGKGLVLSGHSPWDKAGLIPLGDQNGRHGVLSTLQHVKEHPAESRVCIQIMNGYADKLHAERREYLGEHQDYLYRCIDALITREHAQPAQQP